MKKCSLPKLSHASYCLVNVAIESLLNPDLIFILEDLDSRDACFEALAKNVDAAIPALDAKALLNRLVEREKHAPTSTPEGVAFPHALAPEISDTIVVVAILRPGVDFGVAQHPPSDIIFAIFGPTNDPWSHVRILARLARIARSEQTRSRFRKSEDPQAIYDLLVTEDRQHG